MSELTFNRIVVREMAYINKVTAVKTLELESSMKFKVNFNDDKQECVGTCRLEINDKDVSAPFKIVVEWMGFFL
jgi:hypothetical protein